jgi:hypothetical protein
LDLGLPIPLVACVDLSLEVADLLLDIAEP